MILVYNIINTSCSATTNYYASSGTQVHKVINVALGKIVNIWCIMYNITD